MPQRRQGYKYIFELRIVSSEWRKVGNPAEGIELGDAHFMHVKSRLKSCRFSCESAARLFSYFGDLAPLSSLRCADGGVFLDSITPPTSAAKCVILSAISASRAFLFLLCTQNVHGQMHTCVWICRIPSLLELAIRALITLHSRRENDYMYRCMRQC